MKNAAPNDYGALTIKTSKCDAEQLNYCYDGRSKTMLRKFEGQCAVSNPDLRLDCPSVPPLEFVSGVEAGWDDPATSLGLRTIFQSRSGVLYVGGFKLEVIYDYTGYPSYYTWTGKVYKSVDNGQSWVGVELPNDNYWYGYVRRIIQDSSGALYAAGTRLWKSTDGGNTWSIISQSFADVASAHVYDVLESKDGSLIALVYKFQYPNEVYQSYDGGKTWQLILKPDFKYFSTYTNSYITSSSYNFIEANDGSLIFSTHNGDIYLYSNDALTKILTTGIYSGNLHFLKTRDGTLYFVAVDPKKPDGALVSYQSSDNGRTWTITGELPYSSLLALDAPIEGSDGSVWATVNTDCWQSTIYKSSDKGVSWSPVATAPSLFLNQYNNYRIQGPGIIDIAESGGKIYSVPYGFGAVFVVP